MLQIEKLFSSFVDVEEVSIMCQVYLHQANNMGEEKPPFTYTFRYEKLFAHKTNQVRHELALQND